MLCLCSGVPEGAAWKEREGECHQKITLTAPLFHYGMKRDEQPKTLATTLSPILAISGTNTQPQLLFSKLSRGAAGACIGGWNELESTTQSECLPLSLLEPLLRSLHPYHSHQAF